MDKETTQQSLREVIKECFPMVKEEDLEEAEVNLKAYVAVTLRIFDRISQDPEAWARFKSLTKPKSSSTMSSVKEGQGPTVVHKTESNE